MTSSIENPLQVKKSLTFILKTLNKIYDKKSIVYMWKKVGLHKLMVQVVFKKISTSKRIIYLECADRKEDEKFNYMISNEKSLNFYLIDDSILFYADVIEAKKNDGTYLIKIKFPSFVALMERRNGIRVGPTKDVQMEVHFTLKTDRHNSQGDQIIHKSCVDISKGGLSVMANRSEVKFFQIGNIIENAELYIGEEKFTVQLTVMNINEIEPNEENNMIYKGWKIGFSFRGLVNLKRKRIENIVFDIADIDLNSY